MRGLVAADLSVADDDEACCGDNDLVFTGTQGVDDRARDDDCGEEDHQYEKGQVHVNRTIGRAALFR